MAFYMNAFLNAVLEYVDITMPRTSVIGGRDIDLCIHAAADEIAV